MDTEEYHDDNSMAESEDVEEEEEEERYRYGYYDEYGYNEHECKECKKCTTDASYAYVGSIKPVIFTVVPKLMNIASVIVAVSLWHHVNVTHAISRVSRKCAKDSEKWKTLCKEVLKLPEELPVPKSIREIFVKYLNVMATKISHWVSYHFRVVFLKEGQDKALYKLIYLIAWCSNGAINYKQTAINMLSSLRLSDVEKFKFLATYCLKEEMQRLPSSLFASTMLEYVNFSEYPLIYYWYCYFRNELHKIPVTGNLSIDCFMFRCPNVDNWSAKEYFFDRMNSDQQVQQVIHMIDQYEQFYLRPVLLKLNETQRLLVCMERPNRIATYYAENKVYYKEFLSIWFGIRNLITEDQFIHIFRVFLRESSTPSSVLMKIYTSAPENFKIHLLNHKDHEFVKQVFSSLKLIKSELIFTMLQDANDSIRKSIAMKDYFTKFCKKLLARSDVSRFNRLVNLCFPNTQDSAPFTLDLVRSLKCIKDKCLKHYSSGNLKDINDLLTPLFPSNSDIILNYKKDLLMSPEGREMCVNTLDSKTDILSAIIADASLSTDSASTLIEIIFSSSASRKFKDWIMDGQLTDVQNCIDRYLPSNEVKTSFKKTLITNPVRVMRNILKEHDVSYWQSLILWYYEDENLVHEFKQKLKVDSLFIDMLKASVFEVFDILLQNCKFKSHIRFDRLDRFLNWYFQSPNEEVKYKMKKIYRFESIEMITVLLKKKDNTQLKAVMKWFFQNDAAEINKFKLKHGCKHRKLCDLI